MAERRTPTDQQLLQQTLLGEAVDHAPFAVFVFDEDRNHVAVNEAACVLTGYSRAELLDSDVFVLAGQPERAATRMRQVLDGRRTSGRALVRRKDGTTIRVAYRLGDTSVAGTRFLVSVCWQTGD